LLEKVFIYVCLAGVYTVVGRQGFYVLYKLIKSKINKLCLPRELNDAPM
jgi:hypothetical protein